jgi:sulfite dehydrogenase (cytochrome) subunit B
MGNLRKQLCCVLVLLGLTVTAVAQQVSIKLPADNPSSELKQASGVDTVRRNCVICHSTDYIVRQPRLDAMRWQAEVRKMIDVFGAPISEPDAKVIADYLANNYGPAAGSASLKASQAGR